ncbi:MAG TPA: hypothetical protein VNT99_17360 [Methylomirabilota bacterium]|nr:hypothetical protein [Methylomirabilota bacterium]
MYELEHLTDEDILQAAEESVYRYKPEPFFSKTGVGYLRPASPEERAQEEARSNKLIQKLEERAKRAEKSKKA